MFRIPNPARRAPALALLGVLALAACQDESQPITPSMEEPALSEASLTEAATQADATQDGMIDSAQRDRDRDRTRDRPAIDRVGLAVQFASASIDLVQQIFIDEGADERQRALLEEAMQAERAAKAALEAGDTGLAVRMAQQACWGALKAWVAPGGVTREEAEKVHRLATELLSEAAAQVGDDDGIRGLVLSWAISFYTHGDQALQAGQIRGVAALWKAAVLSFFLIS